MAEQQNPDAEMNHEAIFEAFLEEQDAAEVLDAGEAAIEAALEPAAGAEEPAEEPEADEPDDDDDDDDDDEVSEDADEASKEAEDEDSEEEELHPAEKRRREQQAFYDAKLEAVNQQLEQMQQWAQQVYQAQMMQAQQAQQAAQQPQNPALGMNREHVVKGMETDPVTTFQTVAVHRPDLVPTTIAVAREKFGDEVGDQMQVEYNQYLIRQERQAREAEYESRRQAQAEAEAPQQIKEVMSSMIDGIAQQHGEAFVAVQTEFVDRARETAPAFKEYMESQGLEMTPEAVHYFLTKTFNDIREERISQNAAKPRKARKMKASEAVETSTNGAGNRPEDLDADQIAINELLDGAKELQMDITAPNR